VRLESNRWWIYQRERFPVFAHAALIFAFSSSAISYSALLRGPGATPSRPAWLIAFVSAFLSFLQLRLADEFKDFEEDSRYRPYRPVSRGLVKLSDLARVWIGSIVLQFLLALWLQPRLLPLLLLVWAYLGAMSREFFVKSWLKARPFTYMWTHMLIMPLIDLYTTACDWLAIRVHIPHGLFWFLLMSFFNGMVIELGRKIRAPQDEEKGVETYSFLWGRRKAVLAWWTALLLTGLFALVAAHRAGLEKPIALLLLVLLAIAATIGVRYLTNPATARARLIETYSGVWSLVLYLSLGTIPLLYRMVMRA